MPESLASTPAGIPTTGCAPAVPAAARPAGRGRPGVFDARGYVEVETPYAVKVPGEEVHLSAFATERVSPDGARERLFLHTSRNSP